MSLTALINVSDRTVVSDGAVPAARGHIGKTWTLPELAEEFSRLRPLVPRAVVVLASHGLDPKLREKIMLSIAKVNGCRICSYAHQEWAIQVGVSDEEIAHLEGIDPEIFDRATWSALVYARALTEHRDGQLPVGVSEDVRKHYGPDELRDIEAISIFINLVSRSVGTVDALVSRLRGGAGSDSLAAELVIAGALLATTPLTIPVVSLILRRTPRRILREFRAFIAD